MGFMDFGPSFVRKSKKTIFPVIFMGLLAMTFWYLAGCTLETRVAASADETQTAALDSSDDDIPTDRRVWSRNFRYELALHWAPEHLQDIDNNTRFGNRALSGKSDYLTTFNFDGDWNMENNWNNLAKIDTGQLISAVYYSVVADEKYWYIIYTFFHPRDWTNDFYGMFDFELDQHENDIEGFLAIVRKNESYGKLEAIVTLQHRDFYSYTPADSSFTGNEEDIDGSLLMTAVFDADDHPRPRTYQEAESHALRAYQLGDADGTYVTYKPALDASDNVGPPTSNYGGTAYYALIDLFANSGLFERRNNSETFASEGKLAGTNPGTNSATAPWRWDDKDDTPGAGAIATDPQALARAYFNGGDFSTQYIFNPYQAITRGAQPGEDLSHIASLIVTVSEKRYPGDSASSAELEAWPHLTKTFYLDDPHFPYYDQSNLPYHIAWDLPFDAHFIEIKSRSLAAYRLALSETATSSTYPKDEAFIYVLDSSAWFANDTLRFTTDTTETNGSGFLPVGIRTTRKYVAEVYSQSDGNRYFPSANYWEYYYHLEPPNPVEEFPIDRIRQIKIYRHPYQ